MKITAAVVRRPGGPFELEDVELEDPRSDEIVVRVAGTGICHTDLSFRDQRWPFPLPAVLGHEGAGIIERVGASVRDLGEGDTVVLGPASCGDCPSCLSALPTSCRSAAMLNMMGSRPDGTNALRRDGETIHGHFVGQSSFATHVLAEARSVIKVETRTPTEMLGPLACSLQTGAGAVLNVIRPSPGSSIVIFGVGAVGLSAVMAAKLAGLGRVIAVDRNGARLDLARELGATDAFHAEAKDLRQAILDLTKGGADAAVEASGSPEAFRIAFESIHSTGVCALVGAAPPGTEYAIESSSLLAGRTLRGVTLGMGVPKLFIPLLLELHARERFPFEKLVRRYEFRDINQAARDAETGGAVKPIICMKGVEP